MVQQRQNSETGTANEQYNLISVIYHSLQSATVCDTYIQDADSSGDSELSQFFQQVKEQNCQQAEQAKKMMTQRMSQ